MTENFLIPLFLSLFGYMIVFRTLDHAIRNARLVRVSKKYRVFFLGVGVAMTLLLPISNQLKWWFWFFIFLGSLVLPIWIKIQLRRQILRVLPLFCEQLVLSMRSGESLRRAIRTSLSYIPDRTADYLQSQIDLYLEAPSSSKLSLKNEHSEVRKLLEVLRLAEIGRVKAVERVQAHRDRLRLIAKFRRKSGQASAQARLQSLIVLIIFVLAVAFINHEFGWNVYWRLFWWAMCLQIAAIVWIAHLGRKKKWKV